MIIVVVDANVLVRDLRLASAHWRRLADAVAHGLAQIVLPEVAFREAVKWQITADAKITTDAHDAIAKALSSARRSDTDAADALQKTLRETLDSYLTDYSSELTEKWARFGFTRAETPTASLDDLADRAMHETPPFSAHDKGFRDTIIWLTLIDIAKREKPDAVVLLSDDGDFGSDVDFRAGMREEFTANVVAALERARSLKDVKIPGHYEGDWKLTPGLKPALETGLRLTLTTPDAMREVDGGVIGAMGADWITLERINELEVTSVETRDLTGSTEREIRFSADVAADFVASSVWPPDKPGRASEVTAVRGDSTVIIEGTAITTNNGADIGAVTLDTIESKDWTWPDSDQPFRQRLRNRHRFEARPRPHRR